jgi:hypothetical protein
MSSNSEDEDCCKKRSAETLSGLLENSDAKRSCPTVDSSQLPLSLQLYQNNECAITTLESTFAVPLEFIFREHQQKPLLTRDEAHAFISINLLAHEYDSLLSLSAAFLEQQRSARNMHQLVQESKDHMCPQLRALVPLYHMLSTPKVDGIQKELDANLAEWQALRVTLRQFSASNWTLAESLLDVTVGSNLLAHGKRTLSDMEEEMCCRIDMLFDIAGGKTNNLLKQVPMKDYCERVWNQPSEDKEHDSKDDSQQLGPSQETPKKDASLRDAQQHYQNGESQQSRLSQQSSNKNMDVEVAAEEKENAPSQQSRRVTGNLLISPEENDDDDNSNSQCRTEQTQHAAQALSALALSLLAPDGGHTVPEYN